jgi:ankyrin repeat protein
MTQQTKRRKTPKNSSEFDGKKKKLNNISRLGLRLVSYAAQGNLSGLNKLIKKGVDVNSRDEFGHTALNESARCGHVDIVKRLIEAGADIENKGDDGMTPLMNGAISGNFDVVKFLISNGAKITDDLLSVIQLRLNILKENCEIGMVRPEAVDAWQWFLEYLQFNRLRQISPKLDNIRKDDASLIDACYKGDLKKVKKALKSGADVNSSDGQDVSALRWAIYSGNAQVIALLIDKGADINKKNDFEWTALMDAVLYGDFSAVDLLIRSGADVNAKTRMGYSVLYFAEEPLRFIEDKEAIKRQFQIIDLLKKGGAKDDASKRRNSNS